MNKKFRYSILYRLIISALVSILCICAKDKLIEITILNFSVNYLLHFLFWEIHYQIFTGFQKFSSVHKIKFHLIASIGFSIVYILLMLFTLYQFNLFDKYKLGLFYFIYFVLFVNALHALLLGLSKYQRLSKQELLKQQELLESKYHSIKSKSIFHILQNSLSANKKLINEQSDLAIKQLEVLTSVLRSLLQNRDKELVSLNEEINSVKEYIKLIEIQRFAKVILNIENDSDNKHYLLPPFVLPLVVDKILSNLEKDWRLDLNIYIENGIYLVLKINIEDRNLPGNENELLIKNLKQRYHLAQELRDVNEIITQSHYLLKVPLIEKTLKKLSI